LDKRVYARVTEQDQRRTIIKAARISGDLPSLREQVFDRQRCLRGRQAGRDADRPKSRKRDRNTNQRPLAPNHIAALIIPATNCGGVSRAAKGADCKAA
jgi:hypothetical protein